MKIVTIRSGFQRCNVFVLQLLADVDIQAAWEAFPEVTLNEEAEADGYLERGHKSSFLFVKALVEAGLAREIKDTVDLDHPSIDYSSSMELDSCEAFLVAPRTAYVKDWFAGHLRTEALKEAKQLHKEGRLVLSHEGKPGDWMTLHSIAYKHAQRSDALDKCYERVYRALKKQYPELDPEEYFTSLDARKPGPAPISIS